MKYLLQDIIKFFYGLLKCPIATLKDLGKNLSYALKLPEQVVRLQEQTFRTPFIIQIETTNACNARCLFCAYSRMKRKKGIMSLALFEKILKDYATMGGGPISFTPVVGDALLDPHLLERLAILKEYPEINQITLTTNAIALDRYSDDEVCHLLETLYCIQVSIGGLNAATYKMLYGVDQFSKVRTAMERLMRLKEKVSQPANLTFAFRTNDSEFEGNYKQQLDEYRQRGVYVSHISTYANYSGIIQNDLQRKLLVLKSQGRKRRICTYGSVAMSVCWDGAITACGCADFDADRLKIGNAEKESLSQIFVGEKRKAILNSFEKGKLLKICRDCSAYRPNTDFALPYFKGIQPHQPLPLEFYQQIWGG